MKTNIHPKYSPSVIKCACGNIIETFSTKPEMFIEICSKCHPFYTGKKKIIDTAGRVERFEKIVAKKAMFEKRKKTKKVKIEKKEKEVEK